MYQFLNVVNGVSRSHKTANIFFSLDSVAWPVNWNVYIGLRDAIIIIIFIRTPGTQTEQIIQK